MPTPTAILNPLGRPEQAQSPPRAFPALPMSQLDQKQVLETLAPIRNREFGGESIVTLGQVADIRICRPIVGVTVTLPNVGSEVADEIREQVREALFRLPGIERAEVAVRTEVSASPTSRVGQNAAPPSGAPGPRAPVPDPTKPEGVQNVVAVASGKGGVGKSTVSANLAVALAADGARVGLLDADVYGPSQTTMFGMDDRPATDEHRRLLPLEAHGVRFISMGMLSSKETPVISSSSSFRESSGVNSTTCWWTSHPGPGTCSSRLPRRRRLRER